MGNCWVTGAFIQNVTYPSPSPKMLDKNYSLSIREIAVSHISFNTCYPLKFVWAKIRMKDKVLFKFLFSLPASSPVVEFSDTWLTCSGSYCVAVDCLLCVTVVFKSGLAYASVTSL